MVQLALNKSLAEKIEQFRNSRASILSGSEKAKRERKRQSVEDPDFNPKVHRNISSETEINVLPLESDILIHGDTVATVPAGAVDFIVHPVESDVVVPTDAGATRKRMPRKLGHEQCESCEEYSLHNTNHTKDKIDPTCDLCQKWQAHIDRSSSSRVEYRKDRDENKSSDDVVICSADLQKVIMLPRIDVFKTVLFTRRIIAFNKSFVPLGNQSSCFPLAVLWHEATAGRKKEEIISAYHAFFLHHRDVKHIKLWLDNCTGQNKNWALFSFLVFVINSTEIQAETIELKFFEPGHTFMSADHFHHQVEKSLKQQGKVYDFNDFVSCVQNANSKKVCVKVMEVHDFSDWTDYSSSYKLNKIVPRPYLNEMVAVKVVRGQRLLFYRTAFDGPEIELNFMTAKRMASTGVRAAPRTVARGIPNDKKVDILSKLGGLMPANRLQFWQDLPTSNVCDLISSEN